MNDFKKGLECEIKLVRFRRDGTGDPYDRRPLNGWIDVEFVPRFIVREPDPEMLMPWALN